MKIRICDDSIRLRLDRAEVDHIAMDQSVRCVTHFPQGNEFAYCLSVGGDATAAEFADGCIKVTLAAASARHWATTETEVSIIVDCPLEEGFLKLLIEKDFECLDPREGEDQSNRFKNPKATA